MSATFSRTTRALLIDNFRVSLLWLLVVMALFGAWGVWFFAARVAITEVSSAARLVGPTQVVAQFPVAALSRVRPGQPARLRLDGFPAAQYRAVAATVTRVDPLATDGRVRVELVVRPETAGSIPLQDGLSGAVEVEVERISPAALLLRVAGSRITASRTPDLERRSNSELSRSTKDTKHTKMTFICAFPTFVAFVNFVDSQYLTDVLAPPRGGV